MGILTLTNAVPEILNVSNVAGVQISNVGSEDVTSTLLLKMSKQINEFVCNDSTMAGAVVTHGTDVLEETAFFLDATVNCRKPVIVRQTTISLFECPAILSHCTSVSESFQCFEGSP